MRIHLLRPDAYLIRGEAFASRIAADARSQAAGPDGVFSFRGIAECPHSAATFVPKVLMTMFGHTSPVTGAYFSPVEKGVHPRMADKILRTRVSGALAEKKPKRL